MVFIMAVDFDGTLCRCKFPAIGKPRKFIMWAVKMTHMMGAHTILWTCRVGKELDEAMEWCREQGILIDSVNRPYKPNLKRYGTDPRKVFADYYLDDKACVSVAAMAVKILMASILEAVHDKLRTRR